MIQAKRSITFASLCVFFAAGVSIEFMWHLGDWTVCSASCGDRGRRVRRARCLSPGGREVSPAMCHHLPRPVAPPVGCNIEDCPPRLAHDNATWSLPFPHTLNTCVNNAVTLNCSTNCSQTCARNQTHAHTRTHTHTHTHPNTYTTIRTQRPTEKQATLQTHTQYNKPPTTSSLISAY